MDRGARPGRGLPVHRRLLAVAGLAWDLRAGAGERRTVPGHRLAGADELGRDERRGLGGVDGDVASVCPLHSLPGPAWQIGSLGLHRSMALEPSSLLWLGSVPPARSATSPKVATAAMLSAYCGGSELPQLMPPMGTPATMSITEAPCE